MFWRLIGFGFLSYFVLMFLMGIAQWKEWKFVRLLCLYALLTSFGLLVAGLVSAILRLWWPRFSVLVFIVLSLWWCRLGWRHAKLSDLG